MDTLDCENLRRTLDWLRELQAHLPKAVEVLRDQAIRGNKRPIRLYRQYLQQAMTERESESETVNDAPSECE
jgi:hypothetical protein